MGTRFHSLRFTRIALFILMAGTALAQSGGTIQGTLTDPSGAVVPEASVTARNVATGVETTRATTAAGLYVLSPLPPGEYTLRVTAPGFQTLTHERITVDALATIGIDLTLTVGSAATEVTVESKAAELRTEDTSLGETVQNKVYDSLPLAMGNGAPRDPTQFIALAPGVSAIITLSAGTSYTSFNGAQQQTNGFYLEGIGMTLAAQGDTRPVSYGISVEAVEQFQVEVNGQKAQYQGQGVENYQLKSGTNQFHGAAYEYFRNTALDARGFFSPFVPLDRQNEYGGNLGGPIKKEKLFFFSNYTGYRYNTSSAPILISIPTAAERNGDFSAFPTANYDPAATTCSGAVCSKPAFPGNIIPQSRISSVSKSFQSYLPAPTNGNINNNYLGSLPRSIHNDNTTNKVDYNLSDKDRIYGVLVLGKWASDYTGNLMPTGTALPLPYTSSSGVVIEYPTVVQLHETHLFSPNLLNTFSAAVTRLFIPILSNTAAGKYPEKAGLTGLPAYGQAADGFPTISFTGANAPANWGGSPFNQAETNYAYQNNLQWVHQNHIVTFGAQASWLQNNNANPTSGTSASFTFSNTDTAGFSPTGALLTTTGNAYASYLLGAVNAATITSNSVVWTGSRMQNHALFAQDDWKVNKKLTLNLGLRWDLMIPYVEQYDRMSFMDPNLANPAAAGRPGALVYGGHGANSCNCRTIVETHYRNFQPRIGVAYSLNEKTVFRGGFVMANTEGAAFTSGGPGQTGYNAPSSYSSASTGQPSFYWDQGIPPGQSAPLLTPGFGTGFTTSNPSGAVSVNYVDPKLSGRAPYYLNWSGGFERLLPGQMTLGVSYSASAGHFLPKATALGIWTDSMNPKYLVLGTLLTAQATPANIAAAQAVVPGIALPFSNYQGTIAQMLRPFPQYAGVSCYSCDLGNSTYNSLQVTLNRRLSRDLTVQMAYTLSKEIDNVPSGGSLAGVGGTRDPYNGKLDKALGALDHRHLVRGVFVYNLPFGKGIRYAPLRAAVANWSVSGIYVFSSGAPLAVTGSGCNDPGVNTTCIASYNPSFSGPVHINGSYGSGNALAPGATAYLDKTAFIDPPAYTFGNLPRSAPYGLFAPAVWNVDMTIRRDFPIRDRLHFSIAGDFFNVPNSVVFAAPGTNIDTTSFGQVATSATSPRKVQMNARITF